MHRSKRDSESRVDIPDFDIPNKKSLANPHAPVRQVALLPEVCADHFNLMEPQISADGVHEWPFNVSCPVDVRFLTGDRRHHVRMNRHEYFEVLHACSGSVDCRIEDRILSLEEGDLAVVGSTLYHRIECRSPHVKIAVLFFDPEVIRCDGGSDSAEYLTPFLLQDSHFPHIVPAETGVPGRVLDMMLRVYSELPALSARSRLALTTYLKMALMLLVNHYASHPDTMDRFHRQQSAVDRLVPLFRYIGADPGNPIHVEEAAGICGMSESYFMSFFRRVTGLSFVEYFKRYRIGRAQALLADTDDSMAAISWEMGFCDQSHFGAVFRKVVGMTPLAYRRQFRKADSTDRAQIHPSHAAFVDELSLPTRQAIF